MPKIAIAVPEETERPPSIRLEGKYIPSGDHKVGDMIDLSGKCKIVSMSDREGRKCMELEMQKPGEDKKKKMTEDFARKNQRKGL